MDNSDSKKSAVLDRVAITLSGLCVLHCLALPLLIVSAPFLAQFSEGHLHAQMLVIVLPMSAIALTMGFRRHQSRTIIAWGIVGMLLLVVGGTVMHARFGIVADRLFTICGAIILAVTHWHNSRFGRRHCSPPAATR